MLGFVNLVAQPCPEGNVTLSSQAEVDSFLITYPNCTEMEGSLSIIKTAGAAIYNLDALSQLTSIGGDLILLNLSFLQSLSGLEALETVGGSLDIENCLIPDSLNAFDALKS